MDDRIVVGWQRRIFALLWSGYASYYLCRMNLAVAQPLILSEFTDWTRADIGLIASTYSVFYAAGQFINAQVGTRFGARRMIPAGLAVIGVANLLFAGVSSLPLMLALWAVNGYCQSIGWPLLVQTMSNWFRVGRRGTMMGLISTCYQGGNVLAWLLAGYLTQEFGWRAAFWVPGLTVLPMALLLFVRLRNKPEDAGLEHIRDDEAPSPASVEAEYGTAAEAKGGTAGLPAAGQRNSAGTDSGKIGADDDWTIWRIMRVTLSSRVLWILALSYFCFNAVRYAFMNWSVQYFAEFHGEDIKNSAFKAITFPLIGALGAVSSGWVSDRYFGGRRAPVCTVMLGILALLCIAFLPVAKGEVVFATVILSVAGFMIYGPDAILTGAAAIDLAHPKAAASATGFIMATGNLGATLVSGFGVGYLLDLGQGNWAPVFWTLAALSALSAAMAALLWNAKPKGKK